jgi:hypothetical protein
MNTSSQFPRPFRYLGWSLGLALATIPAVKVCIASAGDLDVLSVENGPLENMALALWLLSALTAAAAYRRWTGASDRLVAFWLASISCLAMLREADAHILLNPAIIGRFGIHYRIDWLLNPHTGIFLKLVYLILVILIARALFRPPWRLRSDFWRLFRTGDAGIGMLAVAVAGLVLGYSMDDLFRDSPLMTRPVRQFTEEAGEFCGAVAFLSGSLLLWRISFSQRLAASRPPVPPE